MDRTILEDTQTQIHLPYPPENGLELYQGVEYYINYYNEEKVHHTLKETPSEIYKRSLKNAA